MPDRLEGVTELDAALKKLAESLPADKVEPILLEQANRVITEGKPITPYDPGRKKGTHLRDAWQAKLLPNRLGKNPAPAIAKMNYKKAPHSALVEYGTSHSAPHPYFRPTWDRLHNTVKNTIIEKLKELVEGSVK
jgi:HK97 gp10 family phage protein